MNQADERFKFRIWDKRRKRYMGHSPCVELIDERIAQFYLDEDSKVIEQCTGLKDVNGTPIFEGDVVALDSTNHDYEVIWHHGCCAFMCYRYTDGIGGVCRPFRQCDMKTIKVVGNIHINEEKTK